MSKKNQNPSQSDVAVKPKKKGRIFWCIVRRFFLLLFTVILLLVGVVYIVETLSVILQVGYFKLTHGKRLFKMSPIHHHFEMCGWKEVKICLVFSAVSVVMCVVAWLCIQ